MSDICKCYPYNWFILFSSVAQLFTTPWTVTLQASLSITSSQKLLKLMSIKSVMPSNYLILCQPLLLLPSVFLRIRVFSSESVIRIRWPKYCSVKVNYDWRGSINHPSRCHWVLDLLTCAQRTIVILS